MLFHIFDSSSPNMSISPSSATHRPARSDSTSSSSVTSHAQTTPVATPGLLPRPAPPSLARLPGLRSQPLPPASTPLTSRSASQARPSFAPGTTIPVMSGQNLTFIRADYLVTFDSSSSSHNVSFAGRMFGKASVEDREGMQVSGDTAWIPADVVRSQIRYSSGPSSSRKRSSPQATGAPSSTAAPSQRRVKTTPGASTAQPTEAVTMTTPTRSKEIAISEGKLRFTGLTKTAPFEGSTSTVPEEQYLVERVDVASSSARVTIQDVEYARPSEQERSGLDTWSDLAWMPARIWHAIARNQGMASGQPKAPSSDSKTSTTSSSMPQLSSRTLPGAATTEPIRFTALRDDRLPTGNRTSIDSSAPLAQGDAESGDLLGRPQKKLGLETKRLVPSQSHMPGHIAPLHEGPSPGSLTSLGKLRPTAPPRTTRLLDSELTDFVGHSVFLRLRSAEIADTETREVTLLNVDLSRGLLAVKTPGTRPSVALGLAGLAHVMNDQTWKDRLAKRNIELLDKALSPAGPHALDMVDTNVSKEVVEFLRPGTSRVSETPLPRSPNATTAPRIDASKCSYRTTSGSYVYVLALETVELRRLNAYPSSTPVSDKKGELAGRDGGSPSVMWDRLVYERDIDDVGMVLMIEGVGRNTSSLEGLPPLTSKVHSSNKRKEVYAIVDPIFHHLPPRNKVLASCLKARPGDEVRFDIKGAPVFILARSTVRDGVAYVAIASGTDMPHDLTPYITSPPAGQDGEGLIWISLETLDASFSDTSLQGNDMSVFQVFEPTDIRLTSPGGESVDAVLLKDPSAGENEHAGIGSHQPVPWLSAYLSTADTPDLGYKFFYWVPLHFLSAREGNFVTGRPPLLMDTKMSAYVRDRIPVSMDGVAVDLSEVTIPDFPYDWPEEEDTLGPIKSKSSCVEVRPYEDITRLDGTVLKANKWTKVAFEGHEFRTLPTPTIQMSEIRSLAQKCVTGSRFKLTTFDPQHPQEDVVEATLRLSHVVTDRKSGDRALVIAARPPIDPAIYQALEKEAFQVFEQAHSAESIHFYIQVDPALNQAPILSRLTNDETIPVPEVGEPPLIRAPAAASTQDEDEDEDEEESDEAAPPTRSGVSVSMPSSPPAVTSSSSASGSVKAPLSIVAIDSKNLPYLDSRNPCLLHIQVEVRSGRGEMHAVPDPVLYRGRFKDDITGQESVVIAVPTHASAQTHDAVKSAGVLRTTTAKHQHFDVTEYHLLGRSSDDSSGFSSST